MPRIPAHTLDSAPEQTRESLQQLEQKMGTLLNIHAGMAHSPVVLAAYMGIQRAIAEHGTFDARTREAIALAVASVDQCEYCQSAHTKGGTAAGWSTEQTVTIRDGATVGDDKLDTLLAVVRSAASDIGEVPDVTWKQAQEAGWDDVELAEAYVHLALNLYTNYFNHYAGAELDIPAAPGMG